MKIKGYTIKDTNENIIILNSLTLLKNRLSGEVFETIGEIKVDNFSDLVKLNSKSRIRHIKHKENGTILSELEYLEKEKELLSKKHHDSENYQHHWKSLDDEFEYRKFIASYEKVFETVYEEEEIIVELQKEVILDTKHPFIQSKFSLYGELSDVCVYYKSGAYKAILKEVMDELEVGYIENDSTFTSRTEGKKLWSNSSHSCIRYAKLSGDYLFSEEYDIKHSKNGTFDTLVKEYESDRQKIRKIVTDKYLLKFGTFDNNKGIAVVEAIRKIENSILSLNNIIATKKTSDFKFRAHSKIKEAKDLLNSTFKI